MKSFEGLRDKITSLEAERSRLKSEIARLRKAAEDRAATLEGDVAAMREELTGLKSLLGSNENPLPTKAVKPVVNAVVPPNQTAALSAPVKEAATPTAPPLLDGLNDDERKVVEVLLAHGGKYPQKQLRLEAKLSWLQANRVISRLVEQGLVSFEKHDGVENVVLVKGQK
jgi:DNA repair exonuclease SbcCD ATPase subunit